MKNWPRTGPTGTGVVECEFQRAESGGNADRSGRGALTGVHGIRVEQVLATMVAQDFVIGKGNLKLGLPAPDGYWGAAAHQPCRTRRRGRSGRVRHGVHEPRPGVRTRFTPLAWWGRGRRGCGWAHRWCGCRPAPTARCAMASLTLDHLSGGRHILGLGVGSAGRRGLVRREVPKPLARTGSTSTSSGRSGAAGAGDQRRAVLPLPLTGGGTTGLGSRSSRSPTAACRHPDHAGAPRAPRTSR